MTATAGQRYPSLDAMRGIAVMAILLMNIIAFSMPSQAYLNPRAWGGTTLPDLLAWTVNFILVDGKMRGLFSLMFGASMLLVIEGSEDGLEVHKRRMRWLAVFGLIHAYFIWYGDILLTYALTGLMAGFLIEKDVRSLMKWAVGLFIVQFLFWGAMIGSGFLLEAEATAPGADPEVVASYRAILDGFGRPGSKEIAQELIAYGGGYLDALRYRTTTEAAMVPFGFFVSGFFETLGLFALGMALLRNGFLKGEWDDTRYCKLMWRAYALGMPGLVVLAAWVWSTDFDPLRTALIVYVIALPFKYGVMLGHAALAMLAIRQFRGRECMARITATGRAAFTNYIGTSILMTTLFYGYGVGLFGQVSRWQVYVIVPCIWAIMLSWSKPWLERYRFGPLEWLWRSLARGERQAMRR